MREFEPHPLLGGPHRMTIVARYWPRSFAGLPPAAERLFKVEPGSRVLAHGHWQAAPREHPTLVVVHGLEGHSGTPYVLGTALKAWRAGFNVVRLNQRNCGTMHEDGRRRDTAHLTPTLYHSGMSGDLRAVLTELIARDALPEIFFAGFSMGGNLALKMAGELGETAPPELRGVAAVAPALDLAACADAIHRPHNRIYEWNFLFGLKRRLRRKAELFPGRYALDGLSKISSIREFDDCYVAPAGGYRNADDYYFRASARRVVGRIRVPTLILTSQDDPFVPFESFRDPAVTGSPAITLVAPERGGHCGFLSRHGGDERFWAEARIVEFCKNKSEMGN
jgi:predicted alpha/beta-fold hydrolase